MILVTTLLSVCGMAILLAFLAIFSYNWKSRKRKAKLAEELFAALLTIFIIPVVAIELAAVWLKGK